MWGQRVLKHLSSVFSRAWCLGIEIVQVWVWGAAQASLLVRAGHGMHSCCALVWSLYYNDNVMLSTPLGTETNLNYV